MESSHHPRHGHFAHDADDASRHLRYEHAAGGLVITESGITSVTIDGTQLTLTKKRGKGRSISTRDIYAVVLDEEVQATVHVHHVVREPYKPPRPPTFKHKAVNFSFPTKESAAEFVEKARKAIGCISRRTLFIVNPFSGKKKAAQLVAGIEPLLIASGLQYKIVMTERQGHASAIAKTLALSDYDCVVSCGGDGILHEIVNGLLQHEDWRRARCMPVLPFPGGSGNALAHSVGIHSPLDAVHALLRGPVCAFDGYRMTQEGVEHCAPVFGFLFVAFAIIADIDINSESMRWMGEPRFTLQGVFEILKRKPTRAQIQFCPRTSAAAVDIDGMPSLACPLYDIPDSAEAHLGGWNWKTIDEDFIYFIAANMPMLDSTNVAAPGCKMNDGLLDLSYAVESSGLGRLGAAKMMIQMENGDHVKDERIVYTKVSAVRIIPSAENMRGDKIMDLDGERYPLAPVLVEAMPSLLRLIIPHSPLVTDATSVVHTTEVGF